MQKKNLKNSAPLRIKKNVRYDSLKRSHNTKVRAELLDADYLHKLTPEEYHWYAQFTDEYVGAAVTKNSDGSVKEGHIHNTIDLAKKCFDDNNRRNNDLYGVTRANNLLHSIEPNFKESKTKTNDHNSPSSMNNEYIWHYDHSLTERAIISSIDEKASPNGMLTFKEYIMVRKNMQESIRELHDLFFLTKYPNAYLYYTIYEAKNLTEKQLDRLIRKPRLLEKLFKDPEFMKRKKKSSHNP